MAMLQHGSQLGKHVIGRLLGVGRSAQVYEVAAADVPLGAKARQRFLSSFPPRHPRRRALPFREWSHLRGCQPGSGCRPALLLRGASLARVSRCGRFVRPPQNGGAGPLDIESYFDRAADGQMLIRGTRVDITTVLDAYRDGLSPEEIAYNYPTLTLEQVYASLTYYLAHKVALDAATSRAAPEEPAPDAPVVARLRALAAPRRATEPGDKKVAASR